ncbi:MAG: enoyl-CoA hydratase/isomerase family protein [Hyphomicrobiales bacterium]|nr:enoyl-CoA hydratase/isomerase family protein [Hyphomicrobiales bacterium]
MRDAMRPSFEEIGRAGLAWLGLAADPLAEAKALDAHRHKWARSPRIYGFAQQSAGETFFGGSDLGSRLSSMEDADQTLAAVAALYQQVWTLQCFTKPTVSLINARLRGGAAASLCVYGTHRVAAENFRLTLPEAGDGLFPDAGATVFLNRAPGCAGVYAALTGAELTPADACMLGIVTQCAGADRFDAVREALAEGEPIDPFLEALHVEPGESGLLRRQPVIDHCFSGETVDDIVQLLDRVSGDDAPWAASVAARLRAQNPAGLTLTLFALRDNLGLRDALARDYRLVARIIARGGLGHASLTRAQYEALAAPLDSAELALQDHWTLVD